MNLVKKDQPSTPAVVGSIKHGKYDKACEIFRNGEFFDAYLSSLEPGDSFRTMDKQHLWLFCGTKPRMSPTKYEPNDPTFTFLGLEVLQAAPIRDTSKLVNAPNKTEVPRLDDIEDVDFKDV